MKIRLHVSYDGTGYCGWQRQAHHGLPSIQEVMEKGLSQLFQQPITLFASGRTDAGVNALNQVCHFNVDIPETRLFDRDICWALRSILPSEISVRKAWIAPDDFHATLSATHKIYRYFIYNHQRSNPFLQRSSAWIRRPLDLESLQASARPILGTHDFKSFQSAGTTVVSTVRHIRRAEWIRKSPHILQFTIEGDGFLKQMVRNIIGTQLVLEKEDRPAADMAEILASLDRKRAYAPAPPQGLFLWKVFYPSELDQRCRPI